MTADLSEWYVRCPPRPQPLRRPLRCYGDGMQMNPTKKSFLLVTAVAALAAPVFAHGDKEKGNEEKVEWNSVPKAVQTTITNNSSGGQVVGVEKEGADYEAKVKGTDGKMSEVKVSGDGKLIKVEACDEKEYGKHEEKE